MHTACEEEFPSMMHVVLDDVPDNPLARDQAISPLKGHVDAGGCPACQALLDQAPCCLQTGNQFGSVLTDGIVVIPRAHQHEIGGRFAHKSMEPDNPSGDDVCGKYANLAQIGCCTQGSCSEVNGANALVR